MTPADSVRRAMTDDGAFRVMTVRTTDTVQAAIEAQEATGIAAIQLGEVMTSAVLIRETMAPPHRVQVLLRDQHDSTVLGDAFPEGRTRGMVRVEDPALGVRLDDGGHLQVMRSLPQRAPHQGVVEVSPDQGLDPALRLYFRQSEQIATRVAVACVVRDGRVAAAGGYVVQLLPELTEPPLEAMRQRLAAFGDLGQRLVEVGADPNWLMQALLTDCPFTDLAASPVCFSCHCSQEKAVGAIAALGAAELRDIIARGEISRVKCDYCRIEYSVSPDEVREMLE